MSSSAFSRAVVTPGQVKRNVTDTLGYLGDKEKQQTALTNLLYPSQNGGHRDIVRVGWKPAFFNQQWGGSPILGGLDGDLKMDYATGYIEGDSYWSFAYDNTYMYVAQGLKVQQTLTAAYVWVKMYKVGNPTGNAVPTVYDDNAGVPNAAIANGAATGIAGTLITSDTNGAWYQFAFSTPPSLSAGTQYHIVMSSSAANSTTNYFRVIGSSVGKYPFGIVNKGTNVPAWSAASGTFLDFCFAIEPVAAKRMLQAGGAFDYKLIGCEGTPLDQSYGLTASLKDIGFNPYEFTWRGVFTNLAASKPFAEFMYGLDHDRISLSVDGSNHVVLKIYNTDQTTTYTVTGTTAVNSGTFDIGIYVRAKADGADVVYLYVNGTSEGTPLTSQTITFDYAAFRELGTAWLLGGFPAAPTWTAKASMTVLPSAEGNAWTFAGTSEAADMIVSGGKLFQQIVGSTDTANYYRNAISLSNANGWIVGWKSKVVKGWDTTTLLDASFFIQDGTKQVYVAMHSYYVQSYALATNFNVQVDFTKQEHTFYAAGKGADFYLFCDGKMIIDGTGLMTTAAAGSANRVTFGDQDATASANSEVVYDYVAYYNTAAILPAFNSGALSEAALWSGNMTSILLPLYNAGTRISVKQYCGVAENYVKWVKQNVKQEGIVSNSVTSTSLALLSEMERFIYGEKFNVKFVSGFYNDTNSQITNIGISCDGVVDKSSNNSEQQQVAAKDVTATSIGLPTKTFSLHKVEGKMSVGGNTTVAYAARKILTILEVE